MTYKPVKLVDAHYTNSDGKQGYHKDSIVVGKFEKEDSQSYQVLCCIDKNIGTESDQWFEVDRLSELLNKNRTIFSRAEVDSPFGDNVSQF